MALLIYRTRTSLELLKFIAELKTALTSCPPSLIRRSELELRLSYQCTHPSRFIGLAPHCRREISAITVYI